MTSTLLDHRIGIKKESTYGTPVTVNRFYPLVAESTKTMWDPRPRQGKGVIAGGRRTDLQARAFLPSGQGTISFKVEPESKGLGVLFEAGFGVSTVTSVTGGSQQVFHPGVTGTTLPSYTIQMVKVRNDGTEFVETYAGCTPMKATLQQEEDQTMEYLVEFDALSYTTATAAASTSYPSSPVIFDSSLVSAVGLGSTLTVPSTTALASGLTAATVFRSWKIDIDHKVAQDRWILGATRAQPTIGTPDIKFSAKVEFNDTVLVDGLKAGTFFPWYCTFTTAEVLGGGFTQLQAVIPSMRLTKGLPDVKPGDVVVYDIEAEVKNDGTNRDVYLVYRTTDAAL